MSLYTKYRPESFDQMQGQEHIRTTLQNAITQDKIAHAYIFTGPRGTGKTTTARILAKHIVQEDKDPNNTQDIIEMDAASNTSVDDIRHIIENSVIAPVFADKKVYIIDEIHMLSKSAFNALLKTLEEPPKHVYFILATTDIDKVPATVISRCQRFDFRSLNQEELLNKIKNICETEQKEYELSALELLANAAEWGMRNAETLLERIISESGSGPITESLVSDTLGFGSQKDIQDLAARLLQKDQAVALKYITDFRTNGLNENSLFQKLIASFHTQLLADTNNSDIVTIVQKLIEAQKKWIYSDIPFVALDLAVIEICNQTQTQKPANSNPITLKTSNTPKTPDPQPVVEPVVTQSAEKAVEPETAKQATTETTTIPGNFKQQWVSILNSAELSSPIRNTIKQAIPSVEWDTLHLKLPSAFFVSRIEKGENKNQVLQVAQNIWPEITQITTEQGENKNTPPLPSEAPAAVETPEQSAPPIISPAKKRKQKPLPKDALTLEDASEILNI